MKRISSLSALAAIAVLAISSCSIAEQVNPAESYSKALRVKFTTGQETKTAFGEFDESSSSYPVFWTGEDRSVAVSLNLAAPVEALVVKEAEVSSKADFSAVFEDGAAPYRFYAMSPFSAAGAMSTSRAAWTVTIPAQQTPSDLSCDAKAMLLYACSPEFDILPASPVGMNFSHVTSYCRLALKNLAQALQANGAADASVKSVDITFSVPVAGEWYVGIEDGALEEKDASYTITVRPALTDLSQPTDIWFALAPCTLDGATVKVAVNTDMGCLSRSYTYGTRTYAAGTVNRLSLDMTKNSSFNENKLAAEETVYELVTSLSNLNKDDEVIFADAVTPAYAMASTAVTNGIGAVAKDAATGFSYSSEDGYIRLPEGSAVAVLKVASKSSSSYTFSLGSKFLTNTTSGSAHYLAYGATAKTFTAAVSGGKTNLTYKSGSGKTTYSVYCSNNAFIIYSSTKSVINSLAVYRKTSAVTSSDIDPDNDPVLGHTQYGAYLSSGDMTHTPNVTQLSREYAGDKVTFSILFPADNAVLEFSGIPSAVAKGDSFTLSVVRIAGRRKTAVGSFEVTAVREEGSRIWLTDFKGNGFIVKR